MNSLNDPAYSYLTLPQAELVKALLYDSEGVEIVLSSWEISNKKPIYVIIDYLEEDMCYAHWDFGMEMAIMIHDNKPIREQILERAIFDIHHAFLHAPEDPNYTFYHWALSGWLKDRIVTMPF